MQTLFLEGNVTQHAVIRKALAIQGLTMFDCMVEYNNRMYGDGVKVVKALNAFIGLPNTTHDEAVAALAATKEVWGKAIHVD